MANVLYYGNNLDVMRKYIKDNTIELCYIDPPFNSKRNYNQIYNNLGVEDKAQAQAFVDMWTWDDEAVKGYEQITTNYNGVFTKQSIELIIGLEKVLGKGGLLAYLVSMTLRIAEIYRVLNVNGSFYLHCDPTASHYLKLIIDSIFCAKGGDFINEIIWHYQTGGASKRHYSRKHDIILFYTKNDQYEFHPERIKIARTEKALERAQCPQGARISINNVDKLPEDVFEIQALNPMARERLGYPTQKPEALLERIVLASSNEGDTVLDAYGGCGTSIAVAERLKRKWIGIDITYQSISLILKRLEDSFGKELLNNIELNGIPRDLKSAIALANKKDDKTRKEFEKWAVLTYSNNRAMINEKKGADYGIDGVAYMQDRNENNGIEYKQVLFSVKSDKAPHSTYIRDFNGTIDREKAAMGYFITLYPPTRDMVEECKKLDRYINKLMEKDYPRIQIVTVEEILAGERLNIPTSHQIAVVKSAQSRVADKNQHPLFEDGMES